MHKHTGEETLQFWEDHFAYSQAVDENREQRIRRFDRLAVAVDSPTLQRLLQQSKWKPELWRLDAHGVRSRQEGQQRESQAGSSVQAPTAATAAPRDSFPPSAPRPGDQGRQLTPADAIS